MLCTFDELLLRSRESGILTPGEINYRKAYLINLSKVPNPCRQLGKHCDANGLGNSTTGTSEVRFQNFETLYLCEPKHLPTWNLRLYQGSFLDPPIFKKCIKKVCCFTR